MQTRWQANNKSSNNWALASHVLIYSLGMTLGLIHSSGTLEFYVSINSLLLFTALNFVTHFVTDYFTSRATSKAHKEGNEKRFFNIIGLDQLIHQITLITILNYIL